jgi:hypothetical protein
MRGEYQIYDSDAHVLLSPCMWESLPAKYNARRPRPVFMGEESELGRYNTGWFVDGKVLPHSVGPGAQPANTPRAVMEVFGAAIVDADSLSEASIYQIHMHDSQIWIVSALTYNS